jgi:catechol 2,3-dioxygenase-like lactoylglutathione lyase family enzyme
MGDDRDESELMFRVLQIDHVEFFVPDQHEAARWYEHVLGLQVVGRVEHWARDGGPLMISSDGGSTMLALFAGEPAACPQTAAFRRVAFRVTGAGFKEFLERLPELRLTDSKQQLLTPRSVVDHQKAYSIYFTDPYGHLLEVTTYDHRDVSAWLASA